MLLIQPRKEKSIQRCSGCGMFFRKSLIDESFRFPDNFQKYSLMEDVFFSYAAYKKHSNTLIFLPNAKITHYESPIRSVPVKAKIMQNIVHRFLFVKEFGLSYAGYIWTMFVLSMFDALSYKNIKIFTWYIQGMCFVYKNHKLLKLDGSTLDYNAFIFSE